MIDPNASRRPGKMNIAKMLDYVRQNPMAMGGGGMKNPMMRPGMPQPGMPPLQPMMMARSGGAPEPMGAVGPTHGGTSYGGGGGGGGLSAPAPAAPAAPAVGVDPNLSRSIDDGFGFYGGHTPGIAGLQAYSMNMPTTPFSPVNPAVAAMSKRGIDDARGIARGMGGGVNAAGQAMGGPAPGSDPYGYGGFANEGYGSHGYGVNPQTAAHEAAASAQGNYGSSSGAGAAGPDTGGKIVCTAMNQDYGFGSFRQAIWLRHSAGLHPAYERGYHAMFRPLLAYGRKRSTLAQRVVMAALEDIARMRTFDIRREARAGFWRGLNRGRLYRAVLEPLCFVVGLMGVRRG